MHVLMLMTWYSVLQPEDNGKRIAIQNIPKPVTKKSNTIFGYVFLLQVFHSELLSSRDSILSAVAHRKVLKARVCDVVQKHILVYCVKWKLKSDAEDALFLLDR